MILIDKREHCPEYTGTIDEPWFTRESITFLDNTIDRHTTILEYGCGTSTRWYAQRAKHLISIEHDKEWFDRVSEFLKFKGINNVDLRYIDLYNGYINIVDKMGEFDIISVDGRRRSECIAHAYTHVRNGGYLLLDNAEREIYQCAIKCYLIKWKRFDFHNGIWLTSIFKRIN